MDAPLHIARLTEELAKCEKDLADEPSDKERKRLERRRDRLEVALGGTAKPKPPNDSQRA